MTSRLDRYLRTLHSHGYWIAAWYPLSSRDEFECRLVDGGPPPTERLALRRGTLWWGVHADPLEALALAMRKAKLPTEDWDEDTEADNPDDLAAAADLYGRWRSRHTPEHLEAIPDD